MQTVAIAAKCHKFINENLHTTIRGLFYQLKYSLGEDIDENIFNEQAESNPLIEDLEVALDLKREDLNLNANRKGVLAGNIKIMDTFGGEKCGDRLQQAGKERLGDTERRGQRHRVRRREGKVRASRREGRAVAEAQRGRVLEEGERDTDIAAGPGGEGHEEADKEAGGQGPPDIRLQRRGCLGMVHILDDKDREHKPRVHRQARSRLRKRGSSA